MQKGLTFFCAIVVLISVASANASVHSSIPETVLVGKHLWTRVNAQPPQETIVSIKFALKQRNLPLLEELFNEVSDPSSPKYGQYLTIEELRDIVAPSIVDINNIMAWIIKEANVSNTNIRTLESSVTKDYIFLSAPIKLIERLFKVKLAEFTRTHSSGVVSARGSRSVYRSPNQKLYLPDHLQPLIDAVFDVTDFPAPVRDLSLPRENLREPGSDVTPQVIKSLYKIDRQGGSAESSQAVAEFEQAYFYPSDVIAFERKFQLPLAPIAKIIGPNHPESGYLGEASLDTQYIIGVGTNIPSWVFSIGTPGLDLITWANTVMATTTPPLIHSISWGSGESGWDKTLMQKINTEFMKLGLLGMSVFVASGDDGTGNTGWIYCGTFDPNFPASSPYVTTVGGTYLSNGEIAWSQSGGGFSTLFSRPAYQNAAVANYLANGPNMPNQEYFNSSGRGFPDVSALSTNFQVVVANFTGALSGTSAATPTFAAIVSLLNDARYQAGKKPLGFLNPWLYKLQNVGTDILQGDNKVELCYQGFSATTGWDAITGLGTPNLQILLKAALALP